MVLYRVLDVRWGVRDQTPNALAELQEDLSHQCTCCCRRVTHARMGVLRNEKRIGISSSQIVVPSHIVVIMKSRYRD